LIPTVDSPFSSLYLSPHTKPSSCAVSNATFRALLVYNDLKTTQVQVAHLGDMFSAQKVIPNGTAG